MEKTTTMKPFGLEDEAEDEKIELELTFEDEAPSCRKGRAEARRVTFSNSRCNPCPKRMIWRRGRCVSRFIG